MVTFASCQAAVSLAIAMVIADQAGKAGPRRLFLVETMEHSPSQAMGAALSSSSQSVIAFCLRPSYSIFTTHSPLHRSCTHPLPLPVSHTHSTFISLTLPRPPRVPRVGFKEVQPLNGPPDFLPSGQTKTGTGDSVTSG